MTEIIDGYYRESMTEDEAIKVFKELLDVPCEMLVKYDSVATEEQKKALVRIRVAEDMAIQALEEIQQIKEIISDFPLDCGSPVEDVREIYKQLRGFLQIGTIEEFKDLKEKSVAKKPKYTKMQYGKHKWKQDKNGEIDYWAWDFEYCNGVVCEICDLTQCVHCNPDYDELDDCEVENWSCPTCGEKVYYKNNHCKCSQKLEWSE